MAVTCLSEHHRSSPLTPQSRRGPVSPYAVERGQARLENWAEWSLAYGIGTGYPKQCAFARLYQPGAGDVWDGLDDGECRSSVDSDDAERVERFVRELQQPHRSVVKSFYLGTNPPFLMAQRFRMSLARYHELVDEAAGWLGSKPALAR